MFARIRQLVEQVLDTSSVQVELAADPISQSASLAHGRLKLSARRDVRIDKVEVCLIEQRLKQFFVAERGPVDIPRYFRMTRTEVGRTVMEQTIDLQAGQTHEVPFELLFERHRSFARAVGDEYGALAGRVAAVISNNAATSVRYALRTAVHVKGQLLSAGASREVQFV